MGGSAAKLECPLGDAHAAVATALSAYFEGLHTCSVQLFMGVWHKEGHLYGVGPDGALVDRDADMFCSGIAARARSDTEEFTRHDKIMSLNALDANLAAAKVQIALPAAPDSPTPTTSATLYTDFLVLLRDTEGQWRIISKVFSSTPLGEELPSRKRPGPSDAAEVADSVWNFYMGGGRNCDATRMRSIFHPSARLTFSTGGDVCLVDCDGFCERVAERWTRPDLPHVKYDHLRDDPRAAAGDELLSVDFAGPDVALVTLRVGYPPLLYTDFLTMLRLHEDVGRSGWWIVAKSSCNEPFLAGEVVSEQKSASTADGSIKVLG